MDKKKLEGLEKLIKITFKDKDMLNQVFIHRSYLNEFKDEKIESNERLEFLGDAVLELAVTRYLYKNYPKENEGVLTSWRASLVNGKNLSDSAQIIGLGELLYLSKGEEKTGGRERELLLANTFEALIGAIYLDQGFKTAEKFIFENVLNKLQNILDNKLYLDPKTHFQEIVQSEIGVTPTYKLLEEAGPDHNKNFVIGLYVNDKHLSTGEGKSKQVAQVNAAKEAIEKYKKDSEKVFE